MNADVIVVGGGLHGCSAALHLAQRGCRPLVLERSAVARHASGVNAGGVRTLGRSFADLPLALASMERWRAMPDWLGDDGGFRACGQIKIAETEAEFDRLRARVRDLAVRGYHHEVLIDADELRRLLPGIAPHCVGAALVADDGAADPYRTTQVFRDRAERLGAVIREGEEVVAIERRAGRWHVTTRSGRHETPVLVNCAGAWADLIARMAGDIIPISTRCSMMLVTERVPPVLGPVVSAVGRKLSLKQAENGTLVIGGGQQGRPDRDRESYDLDISRLAHSAVAVTALFPSLAGLRIVRAWAGLEAQTRDFEPVIGPSPTAPGLFHAFGFSGHGFQLAPIVGSVIADLVLGGTTALPITPFRPNRFVLGEAA